MYTKVHYNPESTEFISHQKVAEALHKPKGITINSKRFLPVTLIYTIDILYIAKYWRGKILANLVNDSQFTKILPSQSLPLKYFDCLPLYYHQTFSKHTFVKMSPLQYFVMHDTLLCLTAPFCSCNLFCLAYIHIYVL